MGYIEIDIHIFIYHTYLIIFIYKNESLFPLVIASCVNGWTDFANSFLKMFFEVKGEKSCLENIEKRLKHLSLAAAAQ